MATLTDSQQIDLLENVATYLEVISEAFDDEGEIKKFAENGLARMVVSNSAAHSAIVLREIRQCLVENQH